LPRRSPALVRKIIDVPERNGAAPDRPRHRRSTVPAGRSANHPCAAPAPTVYNARSSPMVGRAVSSRTPIDFQPGSHIGDRTDRRAPRRGWHANGGARRLRSGCTDRWRRRSACRAGRRARRGCSGSSPPERDRDYGPGCRGQVRDFYGCDEQLTRSGFVSSNKPHSAHGGESLGCYTRTAGGEHRIRPFSIEVSDADVEELRTRIVATPFPDKEPVDDASQGVQLATIQALVRYWGTDRARQPVWPCSAPGAPGDPTNPVRPSSIDTTPPEDTAVTESSKRRAESKPVHPPHREPGD
jgi:hypothetical protein